MNNNNISESSNRISSNKKYINPIINTNEKSSIKKKKNKSLFNSPNKKISKDDNKNNEIDEINKFIEEQLKNYITD